MSLFDVLYNIFIGPIELLFEFVFSLGCIITQNPGLAIVILSFSLNMLLSPLYSKASEIQEEENRVQEAMKEDLNFIKKTFKGNEQFYIIQTYYRQHNYKPIYALRSSVSLILQIPFFMAAYHFLSNLEGLNGYSFVFVKDLGRPDRLFFGLNLLPVAMTAINLLSSYIYTKRKPLKDNVQLYVMALVFLILLYNTPAALSFYYLLNNLFSLIRNILDKTRNKNRIISIVSIIVSTAGILVLLTKIRTVRPDYLLICFVLLLGILGLSLYYLKNNALPVIKIPNKKQNVFIYSCIFLCILLGVLIPSQVISASPEEFIDRVTLQNPLFFVLCSSITSIGMFVVWFNVYYFILGKKDYFDYGLWVICGIAIVNYLFFHNNFGTLSNLLVYENEPVFSATDYLVNIIVLFAVAVVFTLVYRYRFNFVKISMEIVSVAILMMSFINIVNINKTFNEAKIKIEKNTIDDRIFSFSKDEKNVVVIMMDRAINMYFPYILNEKPELQQQFSGFTYYPNTISFGGNTNIGSPAIYGGYEYSPEEMNKRDDKLLVEKHNEALKVMPVMFDRNDFDVVVCDPTYANYSIIPDLSIFDDYPDIKAYNTEGSFLIDELHMLDVLKRNMFAYGLTNIMPSIAFKMVYDGGNYLDANYLNIFDNVKHDEHFVQSYGVLTHLSDISDYSNTEGLFLMMSNDTTHSEERLQEPDYIPSTHVDNSGFEENDRYKESITGEIIELTTDRQLNHYHVNMASMIQLGKWFDSLKTNGVYDNTRIIIVSDHGYYLHQRPELLLFDTDMMFYNAFLLVKDFDSDTFTIDDRLMANGDVPYLASKDVIQDPVNIFTGNKIEEKEKEGIEFHISGSRQHNVSVNNGYRFIKGPWYSVHDNCLDPNNWEYMGEH